MPQAIHSLLLPVLMLSCLPGLAGQRAFVASGGSDANVAAGCTLAAPCRTFQAAHTAVDAGGEIVALDAAGYAPVTITKSVAIIGNPGIVAGIAAASGDAITIATAGIDVVLRNLSINGVGGINGINMTAGSSISIENCVVSGMQERGISIAAAARVSIVDTVVRDNVVAGVVIQSGAAADIVRSRFTANGQGVFVMADTPGTTSASITDSVASGNTHGFFSHNHMAEGTTRMTIIRSMAVNNIGSGFIVDALEGPAFITVGYSMASGNSTGFLNNAAASGGPTTFESLGNNLVRNNGQASIGPITTIGPL